MISYILVEIQRHSSTQKKSTLKTWLLIQHFIRLTAYNLIASVLLLPKPSYRWFRTPTLISGPALCALRHSPHSIPCDFVTVHKKNKNKKQTLHLNIIQVQLHFPPQLWRQFRNKLNFLEDKVGNKTEARVSVGFVLPKISVNSQTSLELIL